MRANGDGTGAVFTYEIRLQPAGGMRLLPPVLGRMVRSGLRKDLTTLRALLEGDDTEPPSN